MNVGLILIGDELLSGLRQDKHVPQVLSMLKQRGLSLAWTRTIGDDWNLLVNTLRQTRQTPDIVFSFGGIGATPDDLTRAAAAEAFDRPLSRHGEALQLIEQRFGDKAYPNRVRMADLPEEAQLLPNPVNRIPGFKVEHHHFVPGFPDMAWPMIDYALDTFYSNQFNQDPVIERRWTIKGSNESDLIPIMETLLKNFPQVRLSSLPSTSNRRVIDFGLKGTQQQLEPACEWFLKNMEKDGVSIEAETKGC